MNSGQDSELRDRRDQHSEHDAKKATSCSYVTIRLNLAPFRDVELLTMKQTREPRELVAFITAQTGDDLVLSFAFFKPNDPTDIESLTILRTPKYEAFLYEWERGASVSFDRDLEGDDRVLLREVVYASDDKCITLLPRPHVLYG